MIISIYILQYFATNIHFCTVALFILAYVCKKYNGQQEIFCKLAF